ncbi:hypothetical protein BDE36_2695 [Arcticibacter tournemirensis]|uniref:Uncharacterized protein n=1 Tax=Arcticibacter tournemirensis TaxID=699437 RepID=A0A5M9H9P9_9SPHI|nr:hypothetical protein [Arcticibacter tournemirensis]KAA8483380.1 hypothetical protein F1649_09325 [Arcticibacter tournemirensis]TQM50929.1 hypothetical protein BDE36_2695 [Arcticibacter tournemirensis]
MAVIDSKGGIHGTAGSVVYRSYRGMNIVQGRPRRFKQTQASQEAAGEFGLISQASKILREAFRPFYHHFYDGGMVNRMTAAVSRSIRGSRSRERGDRDLHDGELSFLEGLEFNEDSKFSQALQIKPQVKRNEKGQVSISLPEIDPRRDFVTPFKGHYRVTGYRLSFVLAGFNFREEFYEYIGEKKISMGPGTPTKAQELVFEQEVPKGCLLLVLGMLECTDTNVYKNEQEPLNSKDFNPVSLIGAFHSEDEAQEGYGESRIIQHYEEAEATGIPTRTQMMTGYRGNDVLASRRAWRATQISKGEPVMREKSPGQSDQERRRLQQEMEQRVREKLEQMRQQAAIAKETAIDTSKLMGKRVKF